jgi:hypothetical protein
VIMMVYLNYLKILKKNYKRFNFQLNKVNKEKDKD